MNKEKIELEYLKAKNTPSDINEHLEVLYNYASKCESVTELGVRSVVATWAFLKGAKKYVGYDMFEHPNMKQISQVHDDAKIVIADVLNVEIEQTEGMGGKGVDCGKGLWPAITEFLMSHREWALLYKTDRNNGLTIIERK